MTSSFKPQTRRLGTVALFLGLLLIMGVPDNVFAATALSVESEKIEIASGKSVVLNSDFPVKRVSIGNPEVADFILLSPNEIYLTGKSAGSTNLTLWQDNEIAAIYDIEVTYEIARLKQQLQDTLPDEKELQVMATYDAITLAGKVSNAARLNQAVSLAKAYAPEGKIHNMAEVGGVHQVMLEVRVSEMSRSLARRLGINFAGVKGDNFGVSRLNGLSQVDSLNSALDFTYSTAVNALFRFSTGDITWTGFVDALKEDGLVKILAEPTLITMSGQSANFLAGGEFPVPVPQGLGTAAIEYKPFGVGLVFTPTVLSKEKISIRVSPEVSELDFTNALQVGGFVIPGIRTRRASTTIELGDGQSFAIAGLLRQNVRAINSKFPLLGDLPILGVLFQSKQFQKEESELIIIVTPHLVKPLDIEKQPLPTDFYVEPNDAEFYLFGRLEGAAPQSSTELSSKLDGDFGHSLPKE